MGFNSGFKGLINVTNIYDIFVDLYTLLVSRAEG